MWGSGETRGILDEILPYCRQECQEMPLMVAPPVRHQILAAMENSVQWTCPRKLVPTTFCQQTIKMPILPDGFNQKTLILAIFLSEFLSENVGHPNSQLTVKCENWAKIPKSSKMGVGVGGLKWLSSAPKLSSKVLIFIPLTFISCPLTLTHL